jgi:hypothetical protein|tara:strand:+ start:23578 stop:23799 length:222 start_codon:yes stop_codon:yes gene_type:complete
MYRIVREENKLTGKVVYIIEKRKKFLWLSSWTRELGLDVSLMGPIGAPTYGGAKYKLQMIKDNNGQMIKREVQ